MTRLDIVRKGRSNETGKLVIAHGSVEFREASPSHSSTSQRNPCGDARRTKTCVAPVDASRNFHLFFSPNEQRGGLGGAARLFSLVLSSLLADHERDWPPCKVVFSGWQPIR